MIRSRPDYERERIFFSGFRRNGIYSFNYNHNYGENKYRNIPVFVFAVIVIVFVIETTNVVLLHYYS